MERCWWGGGRDAGGMEGGMVLEGWSDAVAEGH